MIAIRDSYAASEFERRSDSGILSIERLPALPSVDDFERTYVRSNRPVILSGILNKWPAFGRWSLDYFRESRGSEIVLVMETRGRWSNYEHGRGYLLREMTMAEALDGIDAARVGAPGGTHIVTPLDRYLCDLLDEVVVPPYAKDRIGFRSRLWVSAAGIGTLLHRDFDENLIAQMSGTKQITLLPPAEWMNLYPFAKGSTVPNLSPITFDASEFDQFPRAQNAQRITVTLEAGDVLYLPNRWWHLIRAVTDSVTLNFWWATGIYATILRVAGWVGLRAAV